MAYPYPYNLYAPTNPRRPEPVGICDRCDFLWPLAKLHDQFQWAGKATFKLGIKVCPICIDVLQENGFRVIDFGPDPAPLPFVRPGWRAEQQEENPSPAQFVHED